ncbi:class I SAM-dependent methyltransferase [Streptomyces sp. NBC_00525]|uniref:class I SAM-dependent methyltransferase n=1 Tax=Streptomyces sp. NBC_00525 TaxID=2903660 RepID=UPI002E80DA93|nr:class I SAM-dependent methyltransferase [Streptomyces sp. NBC_00525]WUC92174.1 class I SAM-dependent methyltransferase [Streptomyces sp. NBC_00525]
MPTLSQEQPDESVPEPHLHRRTAESFGVDAERYDRARPSYPQALVDRIVAASPGRRVLDVGAGTGIEARQFRAAGCSVLGVEPDERMAAFARQSRVEVEVARFEDWQPAGRQFDAVIAGTAWHWVDPVAGAAKAAQVLRPGGRLAPFHHVPQLPAEMIDALTEALRRVAPGSPFNPGLLKGAAVDAYQPLFAKIADGIRRTGNFSEPEQWHFAWERTYSRKEWLDQLPTFGGLTQLPPDKMAEVLDSAGAAIDQLGGHATMPYTSVVITSTRSATA